MYFSGWAKVRATIAATSSTAIICRRVVALSGTGTISPSSVRAPQFTRFSMKYTGRIIVSGRSRCLRCSSTSALLSKWGMPVFLLAEATEE